jgi:glycosyltransferase involved in cell wall biosynthesis
MRDRPHRSPSPDRRTDAPLVPAETAPGPERGRPGERRLRIAYVTETWLPTVNGVVTRLSSTALELSRRDHRLLVIAPARCDQPVAGVQVTGVPSFGIPFIYAGQPWGLPLPRVWGLLDEFEPDLVHAVNPVLLGWAGISYARRRRIPLVCSYHTHVARYARFYHLGVAERLAWSVVCRAHRLADLNLVTSSASAAELSARGVGRIRIWRRGVDLRRFRPRAPSPEMRARLTSGHPERRLALYVGRLAPEKGLERLRPLTAASGLHLALVGDGPARSRLATMLAGGRVTFTGELHGEELTAAYASADVFVFPSTTDTLGLALLEALASGLPVVAARTPASTELLEGMDAGELVSPDDDRELMAAVGRLLSGGPDRPAIARAVRRVATDWSEVTEELLGHYGDALEDARPGSGAPTARTAAPLPATERR